MNEEPLPADDDAPDAPPRGRSRLGCLGRILIVIVALVGLVILIGETFDQGPPESSPSRDLNAGTADEYARSDVTQDELNNIMIVRYEDGSFAIFYDRSTKQQEQGRRDCRVRYDEFAQLVGLPQLPGFSGAFVEECDGLRAVWRADGTFANGAGYGGLDRYESRVDGSGNLIIDLDERTCTRSRGVSGQPPFDETTCGRGD